MRKRKKRGIFVRTGLLIAAATGLMFFTACQINLPKDVTDKIESDFLPEADASVQTADETDTGAKYQDTEDAAVFIETETSETAVTAVFTARYAYQTLDADTQKVYDEIYQAMQAQEKKVAVDTLDPIVLDKAYRAVCADYGEIFWASGYVYTQYTKGDQLVGLDFTPNYTMSYENRTATQAQITAVVEQILAGVSQTASDYEKAKYVFDYLAANVDYEIGAPDNQNIISVFLNKRTVCQGYANALQYLFTRLGIQSAVVTGTAEGEAHAWNVALLDGAYYFFDVTWGNSTYDSGGQEIKRFINYNYFAVTTDEISRTHVADGTLLLPECSATADNYYIREGNYFTEWNPQAIGAVYQTAYEGGENNAAVRFSSAELYEQAKNYFVEEQHITDYCNGITALSYLEDKNQNVLILNF